MPTEVAPENTHNVRHAALEERVLLVAPELGWWRGQYQIRDAEVHVGTTVVDKKATTRPQTKLMECSPKMKTWRERFQKLDSERGALVERFSLPFPIRGVRIIPQRAAAEFFHLLTGRTGADGRPLYDSSREVQSIAYRLAEAADEFCQAYYELLDDMERHTDEAVWAGIRKYIPDRRNMRHKFYIDVTPVALAGNKGVKIGDLEEYADTLRSAIHRRVEEAVDEMVSGPRQALTDALTDLHELISRDGRVSTKSFNPVRDAIEKIRLFDFIANDQLLEQITVLEQRLNITTPSALDHETATNNGFLTAIDTVRREVDDKIKQEEDRMMFGKHLRGFDL